ncbi:phage Gp37/Gp68 family protein [Pseudovibrio sp. POLY-S9]|uniref:phage Gp37/Gp68 family protein n=1 Tax=Pseudovibrio sp. POLY-S9 TaxID=1576596 RepID=UPI0007108311|nr:phage Gp37/Gp68 family protein [Pseudovibrio sp. POLY-S9]
MTKIEWTHPAGFKGETWNPIVGCSVASKGCTNCYAMKMAGTRLKHTELYKGLTDESKAGPVFNGKMRLNEKALHAPLSCKKPRCFFVNSMGDLFHESVPEEWLEKVFAVMAMTPQHRYLILTKRATRMREYCNPIAKRRLKVAREVMDYHVQRECKGLTNENLDQLMPVESVGAVDCPDNIYLRSWPLPNVALGVSVESRELAEDRIFELLNTRAEMRFLSAEPLLGSLSLTRFNLTKYVEAVTGQAFDRRYSPVCYQNALTGLVTGMDEYQDKLDWVIAGGESGAKARPAHPEWFRELRAQCMASGVPFFFKQWGEFKPGSDFKSDEKSWAVAWDGRTVSPPALADDYPKDASGHDRWSAVRKVGKAAAGNLLDGEVHQAFPSWFFENLGREIGECEAFSVVQEEVAWLYANGVEAAGLVGPCLTQNVCDELKRKGERRTESALRAEVKERLDPLEEREGC